VIFDEAHELEDVAGSYFGVSLSNQRLEELARDVEASLMRNKMLSAAVVGAVRSLRERSQLFFSVLPQGEGRFAFDNRRAFMEENGDQFIRPAAVSAAAGIGVAEPAQQIRGGLHFLAARTGTAGTARLS